jgi:murein DD-endopeptidase MepM/ murein hydrolase activator NlpD
MADKTDLDEKAYEQEVTEPAVDTPQTGAGSDVVIASFNIFYNSAGTDYSRDWVNRLSRSVAVIKNNGITVAGLQEVRPDVLAKLQTNDFLGDAYGVFPTSNVGYGSQNPIIWDKSKFTMVESGTKMIRGTRVSGGFDDKANAQVRLRDNTTGQEFTVINGHEAVGNGASIKYRYDGAVNLAKTIADLQKEPNAVPVFTTADYNAKYTVDNPNQRTYQDKKENLSYCVLTNDTGMWDAYDASKNLTGMCPSYGTSMPVGDGPRGPVDHVFMSDTISVSKYDYSVSHPANGSDAHNTLIVHATIPGAGSSDVAATSFTVGTYNLKHEIAHGGDCKLNACAVARSQKQANIILGKSGNPAFDILATQETSVPQHNRFKTMLPNYGYFPEDVPDNQGNAIYWNKAKFSLADSGFINTIDNVAEPFKRPWVALKTTDGSRTIYVMSVHAPNDNSNGNPQKRAQVAHDVYDWAQSKASTADSIIAMGDWNEGPQVGNTYCILTQGSVLQNAHDMNDGLGAGKACPNKNASTIDQIYVSPKNGIAAAGWKHYPDTAPYNTASDHTPTYVKLSFPSSDSSKTTGWSWPLSKNDWTGPFGYNVWGSSSIKPRHAGIDMSGTAGDTVLAAHDGTVQSVGYVILTRGACKWQVVVKATGTPYYYAYQHMGSVSVKAGNVIKAGQKVGVVDRIGPTGDCGSGAHLHFSIEKSNKASSYGDGASVCDVNQVACAKQMTTLPPLCFLDTEGRRYGSYVPGNQVKGSDYCQQLIGAASGTLNV